LKKEIVSKEKSEMTSIDQDFAQELRQSVHKNVSNLDINSCLSQNLQEEINEKKEKCNLLMLGNGNSTINEEMNEDTTIKDLKSVLREINQKPE